MANAVALSCSSIEKTLGKSPAYRKVDDRLYVVKQGSSYVMISVVPSGPKGKVNDRALIRVVAQVVAGVNPEPSLFRQLLILNGQLRFGAFAFIPDGSLVMFGHSILGGDTMDVKELVATVHDVALVADAYDDRIVARYGGARHRLQIERAERRLTDVGDVAAARDHPALAVGLEMIDQAPTRGDEPGPLGDGAIGAFFAAQRARRLDGARRVRQRLPRLRRA